jgi:stage V sporulation protein B
VTSAAGSVDKESAPPAGEAARTAGRGGLAIAGAKVSFILFGIVQNYLLPRLVGQDGYGQASLVLATVSVVNNVVVASSIQGVSRAVSSAPRGHEDEAFRATLRVHVLLAMILSVLFAVVAGPIAGFFGAGHVARPLQLVAAVVLLYGIYAPLVGSLNGRRRFLEQAGLDVGYGALRTAGIAGGALLFMRMGQSGVLGVFAGFVTAAAIIVPIAFTRTRAGKPGAGGPTPAEYGRFLLPLAASQLFLNLLMQTDFFTLRYFLGRSGLAQADADALQGAYRGVQLFSFLPYQLLMSVTFILFPMLARAQADGDAEAVRNYTRAGVRYAMVITAVMVSPVSGLAPWLMHVFYPGGMWQQGGDALRVHCVGMGAFAILGVICAALTGLGHAKASARLTISAVVMVMLGCSLRLYGAPAGEEMLMRAAIATTAALTLVAIAGAVVLVRVAGGFTAPKTIARSLATLGTCAAVGLWLTRQPWHGLIGTVGAGVALVVLAVVVLAATGELGREDIAKVLAVVGKKK